MQVTITSEEGLRVTARTDRHELVLDEPAETGGTDAGMTPQQAFLVSLGACAAITLEMYARRKGWPLEAVRVDVELERPGGNEPPRLTQRVHLTGDLDDEQRERLRVIAGRCPVHRMVEGPLEMEEILA